MPIQLQGSRKNREINSILIRRHREAIVYVQHTLTSLLKGYGGMALS
ncbi:MAG: hypothetical protein V7K50_08205 [Nostoc sp.]